MMTGFEATNDEVIKLKAEHILELPWDYLDENEFIYLYKDEENVCAAIRLSMDQEEDFIWIDEFEVVRAFRKKGIGKLIIGEFLKDVKQEVKLLAKHKSVSAFWYKCGFEYENNSWDEILMRYLPKNI